MKILVTGFDPFGGEKINPSYEAVKLIPSQVAGATVVKEELPAVFGKCGEVLGQLIEKHRPDAVMCVGQAGGHSFIAVEKVAVNLAEARIPDNENQQPFDEAIAEDGPTAYFATLPVKAMVKSIKDQGIPARVTYSAGTFVCNDIMYRLLHMIAHKYPEIRGGFVHVPFDTAQVVDKPGGTPSMPIATIAKALEHAIEAICHHKNDIVGLAGATH